MKSRAVLIILIIRFLNGFTQTTNISGRVVFGKKQIPVPYANVVVEKDNIQNSADGNGFYVLENIPLGTYKITASALGYSPKSLEVSVLNTQALVLNFTLDSTTLDLDEVEIKDRKQDNGITRLRAVEGVAIYEGKKNEVIVMKEVDANMATNNSRQIFAKVPGLNIWESDAAGAQIGIAARGLSPNRSSEFNMRQNGYDMSADALGYPESYYSPPMDAVEKIEVVRGAASLQYGTQFGGMVNFVMKKGSKITPLEVLNRNTVGSYGLFTTFNSLGGQYKKVNYYTFYQYKTGNGWRPNTQFDIHTGYGAVTYQASPRLSISADITAMRYLMKQPGGLTDTQFYQNPQQSNRERNWFQVNWNLASFSIDYKINEFDKINIRNFGFLGSRTSLGMLGNTNRMDNLELYRDLIMDNYLNFGSEGRYLNNYKIKNVNHQLLVGYRIYQGNTQKRQGYGNSSKNPDFQFNNPNNLENSSYQYPGYNGAIFAENIFNIHEKLSITPGIRYEYINTIAKGYYTNFPTADGFPAFLLNNGDTSKYDDNRNNARHFPLFGVGVCFVPYAGMEIYGNFSQNYRAITFTDMRVTNPNIVIDQNLKDERGFNADVGFRGTFKDYLNWDVSVYYMAYKDRIGFLNSRTPDGLTSFRYKTNISDSRSIGVEAFGEIDFFRVAKLPSLVGNLSLFNTIAYVNARYINSRNLAVLGNKVELAPNWMYRAGIRYKRKNFSTSVQYSYVSSQFTEATNALSTPSGIDGLIPSYWVMDWSVNYTYKWLILGAGINNLTNNIYFTRRATSYPGPGIIPSEPRVFYLTVGFKI